MTSPAPGWYPDPGGAAPYRWWNGQAWTAATHDGTTPAGSQAATGQAGTAQTGTAQAATQESVAAVVPSQPAAGPGYAGSTAYAGSPGHPATPGYPVAPGYAATPGFGVPDPQAAAAETQQGPATAYGTRSPFDSQGVSAYAPRRAAGAPSNSLWHQNQAAMWTFIVTAIYIFIALATGIGIIGIVPVAMAIRSQSRGERLAPFAIGAAVIAVVIGVATITHRL